MYILSRINETVHSTPDTPMIFIIAFTNTKPANFRAFQRHTVARASFGLKPTQAVTRERRIKNWRRRWKLELIEKDNPNWLDIDRMPVWPLPKGAIHSDMRRAAIAGDPGSRFSAE